MPSINRFVSSSLLLFVDQILVAVGNWLYWLVISKITTSFHIGDATTIYSLVLLSTTITQLGLEYPLLRRSLTEKKVFATSLIAETAITIAAIPLVVYAMYSFYDDTLHEFVWITIILLFFSSVSFVMRFTLLGLSDSRYLLGIDVLGTIVRFGVGYILVLNGWGVLGILLSYLLQFCLLTSAALPTLKRRLGLKFGGIYYFKEIIHDAIANTPSKFARTLIFSLSVVMLASFGISSSEVGIFYIALMMSIVAGSLAASMAYMIIPEFAATNTDLSLGSARLGISLTAPFISALISSPAFVLSLIGPEYVSGSQVLLVLSTGILPSSIVMITISKFNNSNDLRRLVFIGILQISIFGLFFILFVPLFGILGCAISMLIGFIVSAIACLRWSDKLMIKYTINSCISIMVGVALGYFIQTIIEVPSSIILLVSFAITTILIITLKNISTEELRHFMNAAIRR